MSVQQTSMRGSVDGAGVELVESEIEASRQRGKCRQHPLENASWVSKLLLLWLDPLVALGKKRTLEEGDLFPVPSWMRAQVLSESMEDRFRKDRPGTPVALVKSFWKMYYKEWLFAAIFLMVWVATMIITPLFLQSIIKLITEPEEFAANPFLGIESPAVVVAGLSASLFVGAIAGNTGFLLNIAVATKMRSALAQVVFNKSLRVAPTVAASTGTLTTLMSNDTERIFIAVLFTQFLWIGPITVVLAVAALMAEPAMGPISGLVAFLVAAIVFPVQIALGKAQASEKRKMLAQTDKRVSTIGETLSGISLIKINAWEEEITKKIIATREIEMKHGRRSLLNVSYLFALLFCTPPIMLLAVLTATVLANPQVALNPTIVYTALAYVNVMRFPLNILPRAIAAIAQAATGLERISRFLNLAEQEKRFRVQNKSGGGGGGVLVSIEDGKFAWSTAGSDQASAQPVLENVQLKIRRGELIAIVGKVGSGKSSLLLSILGEIGVMGGHVGFHKSGEEQQEQKENNQISMRLVGTETKEQQEKVEKEEETTAIAYVAQEPWIQNCSVRENIVFQSLTIDQDIFDKCICAAQLQADIRVLPNGLDTDIGDRGVNLSGGQRARIAIARCLYRTLTENIPLVLLDDCFSALDPEVGLKVYHEMVMDSLADRARVVVLNSQLHLLNRFDRIIALEEGQIVLDEPTEKALANPTLARVIATADLSPREHHPGASPGNASKESQHRDDETVSTKSKVGPGCALLSREDTKLYKAETRQEGVISCYLYALWLKLGYPDSALQPVAVGLALFLLFTGVQVLKVVGEYWVGFWTSDSNLDDVSDLTGLAYFAIILASMLCCALLRGVLFMTVSTRSSINLHNDVLKNILRAPVNTFFDTTPAGRILNRISSDLDKVDAMLPQQGIVFLQNLLEILSTLILCVIASPFFICILAPVLVLFIWLGNYFAHSSRDVKRIDSTTRSPLFSMFAETLAGLATVRAFQLQRQLCEKVFRLIDKNTKAFFTFWVAARWLALRLDMLIVLLQTTMAILAVTLRSSVDPSIIALALVYSLTLSGMLQFTVRLYVEVQNYFTSIERLVDYSRAVPQESGYEATDQSESELLNVGGGGGGECGRGGKVEFQDVTVRYRPGLPLVLKGVTFTVEAGCNVGIVGRTGSGKSTLGSCLLRMVHPGLDRGSISIDGVDIAQIPLQRLRRMLGVISQTPFLFSGSLRFNLDPWGEHSDQTIINALRLVGLGSLAAQGLDFSLTRKASNLSVGQRQLVQICRTMLRQSSLKLVLCDEMSANVDSLSDNLVQETIKVQFRNQTVLTIAHRLNSLLGSDKIAVLSFGTLVEFGSPAQLMQNKSHFYDMVCHSGLEDQITPDP